MATRQYFVGGIQVDETRSGREYFVNGVQINEVLIADIPGNQLLQENGFYVLLEDGCAIELEHGLSALAPDLLQWFFYVKAPVVGPKTIEVSDSIEMSENVVVTEDGEYICIAPAADITTWKIQA